MRLIYSNARNTRNSVIEISECTSSHNARAEGIIDKIAPAMQVNLRGCVEVTDDAADVKAIQDILAQYKSGIATMVNGIISNDEDVKKAITEYVDGTTLGRAPNLKANTRSAQRAVWNGQNQQPATSAQPAASPVQAAKPAENVTPVTENVKIDAEQPKVEAKAEPSITQATPTSVFRLSKEEYRDAEKAFAKALEKGANFLIDDDLCIKEGQPIVSLIDTRTTNSLLNICLSESKIPGTKKEHTMTNHIYGALMLATGDDDRANKFLHKTKYGTAKDEWKQFLEDFKKYGTMLVAAQGGLPVISDRLEVYIGPASAGKDYIIEKLYPKAEKILMTGTKEAVDYVNPPKFVDGKGMDYVKGALVRIADKNGNHPSHIAYMPEANMASPSVLKEMLQPLCDNSSIYKYGDGPDDFIEIHPDFKIVMSLNPTSNSGSINVFEQPLISRMGRIFVYNIDAETATERALSELNKGKMKSLDEFTKTNPDIKNNASAFLAEVQKKQADEKKQRELAEQQRQLNEQQRKLDEAMAAVNE